MKISKISAYSYNRPSFGKKATGDEVLKFQKSYLKAEFMQSELETREFMRTPGGYEVLTSLNNYIAGYMDSNGLKDGLMKAKDYFEKASLEGSDKDKKDALKAAQATEVNYLEGIVKAKNLYYKEQSENPIIKSVLENVQSSKPGEFTKELIQSRKEIYEDAKSGVDVEDLGKTKNELIHDLQSAICTYRIHLDKAISLEKDESAKAVFKDADEYAKSTEKHKMYEHTLESFKSVAKSIYKPNDNKEAYCEGIRLRKFLIDAQYIEDFENFCNQTPETKELYSNLTDKIKYDNDDISYKDRILNLELLIAKKSA